MRGSIIQELFLTNLCILTTVKALSATRPTLLGQVRVIDATTVLMLALLNLLQLLIDLLEPCDFHGKLYVGTGSLLVRDSTVALPLLKSFLQVSSFSYLQQSDML